MSNPRLKPSATAAGLKGLCRRLKATSELGRNHFRGVAHREMQAPRDHHGLQARAGPSPLTLEREVVAELAEDSDQGAVFERGKGRLG